MLNMRKAKRLYRNTCTEVAERLDAKGNVISRHRYRTPGSKSLRAWIRTEYVHAEFLSPKLQRILGK